MKNVISSFSGEYEFLSNFYPVDIPYDGLTYPSVEHAYQAMKSLDLIERVKIRNAATPGKAKRLGGKCVLPDWWEESKVGIMGMFLVEKFGEKNPVLQKKLMDTGSLLLVEGNTWGDTFWGVCDGVGQNHLGELLMDIRYSLYFN